MDAKQIVIAAFLFDEKALSFVIAPA